MNHGFGNLGTGRKAVVQHPARLALEDWHKRAAIVRVAWVKVQVGLSMICVPTGKSAAVAASRRGNEAYLEAKYACLGMA